MALPIHRRPVAAALLALTVAAGGAQLQAQDYSQYDGAALYKRFCASCHGAQGRGDGPVAASFRAQVPDLTRMAKRAGGSFPLERARRIIDGREVPAPHGARDMPVWGVEFSRETVRPGAAGAPALVERLVEYLRALQQGETQ